MGGYDLTCCNDIYVHAVLSIVSQTEYYSEPLTWNYNNYLG